MNNLEPIATNKSIVKTFIEHDNKCLYLKHQSLQY